jgi:hypothetical protein
MSGQSGRCARGMPLSASADRNAKHIRSGGVYVLRFVMGRQDYSFVSRWRVPARPEETAAILTDASALPRWWPSVYLRVEREGDVWHVHSRGWLPYTLRWSFEPLHEDLPHGFSLRAWGDLAGAGEWRFHEAPGGQTEASFTWRVRAQKPLLRYLSWILRPLFVANHRWAMAEGQRAIAHEVARRRLMENVRR